jgi:hypothetical protein
MMAIWAKTCSGKQFLNRVFLVRTDVLEEHITPIIRVTRMGELGTLAITSNRSVEETLYYATCLADSCCPDDGGDTFLQNIGSYKSHAA